MGGAPGAKLEAALEANPNGFLELSVGVEVVVKEFEDNATCCACSMARIELRINRAVYILHCFVNKHVSKLEQSHTSI